jgi:hypothetical protein
MHGCWSPSSCGNLFLKPTSRTCRIWCPHRVRRWRRAVRAGRRATVGSDETNGPARIYDRVYPDLRPVLQPNGMDGWGSTQRTSVGSAGGPDLINPLTRRIRSRGQPTPRAQRRGCRTRGRLRAPRGRVARDQSLLPHQERLTIIRTMTRRGFIRISFARRPRPPYAAGVIDDRRGGSFCRAH